MTNKNKPWNDNIPPLSFHGQITLSKFMKLANEKSQSRSLQYKCIYPIWWKSIEINSSYCPESKIRMYCGEILEKKGPMKNVNKHCLLDTPRKVMVDIKSSSVQNIKINSIATATYRCNIHAKYYKILKIMKQDRQEKQKCYGHLRITKGNNYNSIYPLSLLFL